MLCSGEETKPSHTRLSYAHLSRLSRLHVRVRRANERTSTGNPRLRIALLGQRTRNAATSPLVPSLVLVRPCNCLHTNVCACRGASAAVDPDERIAADAEAAARRQAYEGKITARQVGARCDAVFRASGQGKSLLGFKDA